MAQYLTSSPRYWWFYSTLQQDFCLTVPPPSCWLPGCAHSSAFKALEKARVTSVAWKFPAPNAPLYACLLHVEDSFICRNVEVWQSAKSWSSKFHSIFSLELTAFLFGNNFNLRSHQRPAGKVTVLGRFYLFFFLLYSEGSACNNICSIAAGVVFVPNLFLLTCSICYVSGCN